MEKKKRIKPVWFLVIGIVLLVVPSAIYLGFLIPQLKEEYIILMSSGGIVGVSGTVGCNLIPETAKYGTLYKTASKSFTMLVVITLVQEFIGQLLWLGAIFAVSFIIFIIFREIYRSGKQREQNEHLAEEISRGITEASK